MTPALEDLSAWCSRVPGLRQVGAGHWAVARSSTVSYPDEDMAALARIEPVSYWFNHRNAAISLVVRRFPPAGTIFDIGGGNGYVSRHLVSEGFACAVIEPDPSGAATALARGLPTVQAAFQDLEVPDGSMPAAAMFDVLEHIEDAHGALLRLHDALCPGGRAYVTVPAYDWLWSAEDVHAGHFRRYARRSLGNALAAAGFEVEFSSYLFAPLVPALLLFRALPSRLGMRRGGRAQRTAEHGLPDTMLGRIVGRALDRERTRLAAGHVITLGSSVLAVARRQKSP